MPVKNILYKSIYIDKKSKYLYIKNIWLNKLDKIAKRRQLVEIIEPTIKEKPEIKKKIKLDKDRLKGWARICQKDRQPIPYTLDKLLKEGFKYDKENNKYIKEVTINKKKTFITAVQLNSLIDNNDIYWVCNTNQKSVYVHIGFNKTGKRKENMCLPCCFKKDQSVSNSKHIRNIYNTCVGKKKEEYTDESEIKQLYILKKIKI